MKKREKELAAHVEKLIELSENIRVNQVTILTGANGKGKSLIRKIVSNSIAKQLGKENGRGICSSTSQEARCGSNPEWGALSGALRDDGWTPTSAETVRNIKNILDDRFADKYIIIDEPEIGMGEETVMGLVDYMNKRLAEFKCLGVLVITHNRYIVWNLKADAFVNIEGMTKQEWIDRKLVAKDLDELEKESTELFHAIQNRINENQKKKNN